MFGFRIILQTQLSSRPILGFNSYGRGSAFRILKVWPDIGALMAAHLANE